MFLDKGIKFHENVSALKIPSRQMTSFERFLDEKMSFKRLKNIHAG